MARAVNAETLSLVKQWEGFRPNAYPDPGSRDGTPWTIGYGQTRIKGRAVRKGDTIAEAEAASLLVTRLAETAAQVERLVKVDLSDNQFGALVAFADNIGMGGSKKVGFSNSTLLKKLNAGNYDAVPGELAKWKYNDGKVMQGLVNRRAAEAGLWAKGAFVSTSTVEAKPGNPIKEMTTPENIGAAGGLLGGAAAVASGNGPVQYAIAALMVIAAITIAFLVIRKATR
ncbi:lysozyme [Devosia ginsengisoli]|uniref:Lysozyme n=1 Tax=Devosia ginsengisoli TaxID=400770 RepID=A0A5B8LQR5_9HYPH|nr:lysozyme [Devosia ginsengisoli]QDZ10503.1 lysozyme [Devosia ginsengisoli]